MIRLASACEDDTSRRDTRYAEEDDDSAVIVDEIESVGVAFVDVGVSKSECVVVAGSVSICRTLLNDEVLR